jgi:BolA protein
MQRHRLIYAALKEELDAGLHSLSLQTKTEEEELLART